MRKTTVLPLSIIAILAAFFLGTHFPARIASAEPIECPTAECLEQEADILQATVRIHIEAWRINEDETDFEIDETMGHATLVAGRYLVTHNHFELLNEAETEGSSIRVVLYNSCGNEVLFAPLRDFNVHAAGEQTLVFEMKLDSMAERLEEAGIRSAETGAWEELGIRPGDIVAQVSWDGRETGVQWTTVEQVVTGDGVPRLLLANGVERGSSGGGVFRNGVHIANNWEMIQHVDANGGLVYTTGVASLNSELP